MTKTKQLIQSIEAGDKDQAKNLVKEIMTGKIREAISVEKIRVASTIAQKAAK